jgi:NADH-quinone oxidoreductase subunit J
LVGVTAMVVGPQHFGLAMMPEPAPEAADYNNIADLGMVLYTQYALPFIVSGVLLLTAIVAAIGLTHRVPTHRKSQVPSKQIAVRRRDRVRLVDLPSEKPLKPSEGTES